VLNASLTVTPISALDVEVGYERRDGRKLVSLTETYDLKTADNLVLGAKYRINDQLNVWARLENMLNTRYYMISGLPAQGFSGLIGVGYKF
jgi:outer membrane cobalamin receptor